MTTQISQLAIYRGAESRYHAAIVVRVVSGDNADLLVLGDLDDWEDSVPAAFYARVMSGVSLAGVAKGSGVGQWAPVPVSDDVAAAIADAVAGITGYATTDYVDSGLDSRPTTLAVALQIASSISGYATTAAMTSAISSATSGLATSSAVSSAIATAVSGLASSSSVTGAVAAAVTTAEAYTDSAIAGAAAHPVAGTSITIALAAERTPSNPGGTHLRISGVAPMTSTLVGTQSVTVTLFADASAHPTTIVDVCGPMTLAGVAATTTHPWCVAYDLPAGHTYKVSAAGNAAGAAAITHINETPA